MFSVLVIRLRSLRLLRVSGIVMRLRMFLLLITFLKASHSFRNRLLVICKNAYLFATRSEERFSRNAETDLVCRLLLEKKKKKLGRASSGLVTIEPYMSDLILSSPMPPVVLSVSS